MPPSAPSLAAHLPLEQPPGATPAPPAIPDYLQDVYWWAYLHPNGVRLFERQWLVNLILWGNFSRLRDAVLAEFGTAINQRILQIACVYGDFTQRIAARLGAQGRLDVVDVAPIQLANLRRKLPPDPRIHLHQQDASALHFADASFDATLLFFLLHEQPAAVRRATLAEALRVTRPGGKIVIVDYHKPSPGNPLRYLMTGVLKALEPFALDLWEQEIATYLPTDSALVALAKSTSFGGLYQKVVISL
ncbi:rhodoquinone biosynthesis methyltransferase RquA [Dechloromonas denitrificans]|uniref:rhodoquinone biosynthesis methyltransferase RquA n=1 Tax=Dechloromonas denitrificans TaxID=281362 RepID=UPI001CF901A7|nr:rhodoquinone biosynthesis methyltransferase RquA [Dechloromonas denitrificans]UCV05289.1 rhodoquinone biosynthesis methyltransferase RquA [Dechloromonas denitrificans]